MRRAALPARPVLLACAALGLGCRHWLGLPAALPDCPGELVATGEIAGEFLRRESVRVRGGGVDVALELAVQRRGEELTLVGLSPLGARLFSVTQRGLETSVDAPFALALEVPPLNLLRDLHRVRFLAAGAPPPGEQRSARVRGATRIEEEWRDGRLAVRRLESADARGGAAVEIRFEPGAAGAPLPRALLRNPACGYQATWVALSEQRLP
jgi:hypothetical protein